MRSVDVETNQHIDLSDESEGVEEESKGPKKEGGALKGDMDYDSEEEDEDFQENESPEESEEGSESEEDHEMDIDEEEVDEEEIAEMKK